LSSAVADTPVEIQAHRVRVTVGTESLYVGRLSVRQMLGFGRLLPEVFAALPADKTKSIVAAAAADPASDSVAGEKATDWTALAALLDEGIIGRILEALLDRPADWCLDNCDMVSIGQIAEAIIDNNEVDTLRRVFSKATGSLKTSPTSSAPGA
jgi:hypothetical protein